VADRAGPTFIRQLRGARVRQTLRKFRRWLGRDDGPTAVEYAVMLALIMLTAVAGARTVGCNISDTFEVTAENLGN
jgi:pilus assembly protein Flp/PilA